MSIETNPLNIMKKPAQIDWHKADIVAAVRKAGSSLSALSRMHGYTPTIIGHALHCPCPKYERLIAEFLNITPQTIWPSRYHEDGTSKSARGERGLGRFVRKADRLIKSNDNSVKPDCNVNVQG